MAIANTALRALRRLGAVRVLVIGDLMMDQFIWGRVERISPEAPVPVVQVIDESFRLGGAANVVHNVRALGCRVTACGVVGTDAMADRLLELLRRIRAGAGGVLASRAIATIRKTRIIAHHQQVVRLDRETPARLPAPLLARLAQYVARHLSQVDVVVVSDYGKGVVTPPLLAQLAAGRAKRGFHLLIDPKQPNFSNYRGASLLTPNATEASQASGVTIHDARTLRQAGRRLIELWEADAVLITRGEHGMTLFRRGGGMQSFPTVARHVFDVTGAGDTVVATCAAALGAGASVEEAALLANHAAGIVVAEVGTATATASQLRAALRRG